MNKLNSSLSYRSFFKLVDVTPFFLSAALYLSLVFTVFSPLPLVYANLRFGRIGGVLASISNFVLVHFVFGRLNSSVYFVVGIVLAAAISECARLKVKIEKTVLFSVLLMIAVSIILLLSYYRHFQINPIDKLDAFVASVIDHVSQNIDRYKSSGALNSQDLDLIVLDPELAKRNILFELPSFFVILVFYTVVANVVLMFQFNIQNIRTLFSVKANFFKRWKSPEFLVWPTLASGFLWILFDGNTASGVGLIFFKIFMSIYTIQGLAILACLFDLWGVKGFLRPIGYFFAVFVFLPLIISLGFFDLWFNFRKKIILKSPENK